MSLVFRTFAVLTVIICAADSNAEARQQAPAAAAAKGGRIDACSLLKREEVRKFAPWPPMLDGIATQEEPIGTAGSSCNYPSVDIQVLPFQRSTIDAVRKRGKLESVAGVGDEAYLHENPAGYAEVYAKVGDRLLTIQRSVLTGEKMDTAKPAAVNLAKALVAKLR